MSAVSTELVRAWLSARSIARRLPGPVPHFGGFRIDTASEKEICRWVFVSAGPGIHELVRSIHEPRRLVKLFDTAAELRSIVPPEWAIDGGNWLMGLEGDVPAVEPLPSGYRLEQTANGPVTSVEIRCETGGLAATGFAAETAEAFVYDRIETDAAHRRRGLARAVMAALGATRRSKAARQLLVATAEGERLYSALGWRKLSPYSTAYVRD